MRINSHGCLIVNFGTQHFRIIYNRTSGATKTAERKLYQIAGSAKPWVAFGATESSTGTIAGLIWQKLPQGIPHAEYSTLEAFEALSAYHGSVVLRSRELGSKVASVECSWQKANMPDAYTAAINWTEVLNYGLAI